MLSVCLFILYTSSSYGQLWGDLPSEVVSDRIFAALPIKDKLKSVLRLNQYGQSHFYEYHQDDIKLYNQLLAEIGSTNDICYNIIKTISSQLKFSEMYPLLLPTLMHAVSKHPPTEIAMILIAMNLRPINLQGFESRRQNISNSKSSVVELILTFASRALLHYYIPDMPVPLNPFTVLHKIQVPGHHDGRNAWFNANHPWIVNYIRDSKLHFHQYWAIYVSYLYEVTFDLGYNEANIPSLNCVYKHTRLCADDDHQQRDKLRDLMKHGLIVWSRDNINDLRSNFFKENSRKYPFYHYIMESNR